jgi:ferric-dicitrate binding protein FerR (iron transport regulator)
VTEGRVRVESTRTEDPGATLLPPSTVAGTPLLEAGEKAVVSLGAAMAADARTAVERLPPAQLALAVAWQQRVLAFDAALGSRRFGGSFRADDPDGFVALLSASSEIAVEERERETVIRTR